MHAFFSVLVGCNSSLTPLNSPITETDCDDPVAVWVDADGDGYGDALQPDMVCNPNQAGVATVAGDCDDGSASSSPVGIETCDGLDNNCDGTIDEGLARETFYVDADADGFGDPYGSVLACAPPPGHVVDATDCDDSDPASFPGAFEVCDGADNDCNGLADEADPGLDLGTLIPYYDDVDADGYGDASTVQLACEVPFGSVIDGTDCNDGDADIHPGATEVCSDIDEDCDGYVDDADPSIDPASQVTFYEDDDGDGFGDPFLQVLGCAQPAGTASNGDDCDDSDPTVGEAQDWTTDGDGDGVGAGASLGLWCAAPTADAVPAAAGEDCDDVDPTVYPGAVEVCDDGIDQDCSGADLFCAFELGSTDDTSLTSANVLRGNIFYVDGSPILHTFGMYLDLSIACTIDYYVHTGPSDTGPWTLEWSGTHQVAAASDFHHSPTIDLALTTGDYAALSAGWSCLATYYADYQGWYGFDAGVGRLERTAYDNSYSGYDLGYQFTGTGSQINLAYYMALSVTP